MANALGGKVRVNHFNVGWVLTPTNITTRSSMVFRPTGPRHVLVPPNSPNNRLIKPEEIAAAAVYWLSDESIGPLAVACSIWSNTRFLGRNYIKPWDFDSCGTPLREGSVCHPCPSRIG